MGKIRDGQTGACLAHTRSLLDPIRLRVQSHIAGPRFPSTELLPWSAYGRIRHRLYQDTFHINSLPLSVSLGSKLIHTAPHDHHNWFSRLYACQDPCRIPVRSCLVRKRVVSNGAFQFHKLFRMTGRKHQPVRQEAMQRAL